MIVSVSVSVGAWFLIVFVRVCVQAEPEERPKVGGAAAAEAEEEAVFPQAWTDGGESCPEKTVPVRRTRRRDVLRSSSAVRFGMKQPRAAGVVRRDSTSDGHEVSQSTNSPVTGELAVGKLALHVYHSTSSIHHYWHCKTRQEKKTHINHTSRKKLKKIQRGSRSMHAHTAS